jgi:AraC-like DNA-binding protein
MVCRVLPSSPGRDAGGDTNVFKGFAEPVRVVSFVCQEHFRGRQGLEQCQGAPRIAHLARRQEERQGPAQPVTDHVQLRVQPAFGPSDGPRQVASPPFERLRRATRQRVVPKSVCLPPAIQETAAFEDWFGCAISNGETASFSLDPIDAVRPFLTHDNQMWQSFQPDLRRRMDAAREDLGMRARVENALLELLPSGRTQIDDVAGELAVSRRSLQRRLSEEGTSWLDVLNSARMRLAQHYLTNTNLGAAEVSFLLGFEDPNSFFRAFRRWTDTTPEAWREEHRLSA